MLLADLVAASDTVSSTSSRSAKVAALAACLAALSPEEVRSGAAFLAGQPRQGKVGIGWSSVATLADVAHAPAPSLTVLDLDDAVTAVAALAGVGSVAAREASLRALLSLTTAAEADYIRRLLLGELRQGALEGLLLDAVARASGVPVALVRRATMLAGDLSLVAALARTGGVPALETVGLHPLRPVQPMLAATAATLAEALAAVGAASVEWKLDGARIQAHRDGPDVRLFTRSLNDVTPRLPGIVDLVRAMPCTAVVLDGEVLGLAEEDERPDAFQDTMSRFGREAATTRGANAAPLVARFFDCLHVDGRDLIDEPLSVRQAALAAAVGANRVPSIVTDDLAEAESFQQRALALGHEGVMVKAIASTYDAGRRGKAWRKVKPVLTFDLVVLGVEWGSGRRRGWLSNLHLGARDGDDFVMVGKTFKGLTDVLLTWQTARLLELERGRRGHVVEVRPELVVEVAIDGVLASSRYPGGVSLRFARVKRYREDKRADEADELAALRALLPAVRRGHGTDESNGGPQPEPTVSPPGA